VLRSGFAKKCISPAAGAPLAGFAARQGVASGVHDDLFVRTLALEADSSSAALLSVDVLALPSHFVEDVRRRISKRTGLDPRSIMIACTHTHAGPVTISTFFNPDESLDERYMESLAQAIEESATEAWTNRFPARIGVGSGRIQDLGVNRRTRDRKPVDEEVAVIRIDDEERRPRAAVVQYSCHPTVLGPDNLLVSGDFPTATIARIESALSGNASAMFVNGTQGDISVGHSSEMSAIGVIAPGRTFERAVELGGKLGEVALRALESTSTNDRPRIAASTLELRLPIKKYPSPSETAATLREAEQRVARINESQSEEFRKAKSELLYASIHNYYAEQTAPLKDGLLPIEIQGIRIDDAVFVAVPAEVFVEIGLRVKQMSRPRAYIIGITNGYIGYLPNRASYPAGGYEVVSARVNENSEDELVRGILDLEKTLFGAA
jgi:hypothetical protein